MTFPTLSGAVHGGTTNSMGLTYVPMIVKGRGGRQRTVEMFVDSGAFWSLLPEADWRALDLRPSEKMSFALADGSVIERHVSDCRFVYGGREKPSPVILGEGDDVALLGAVTLECLALVLNPLDRTLHPMSQLHLMQMRAHRHARMSASTVNVTG